jgi:hypothetical protein
VGLGVLAERGDEAAAVVGARGQYDVGRIDAVEGDRGEVGPEGADVVAGEDGHGLPGGDDFELVSTASMIGPPGAGRPSARGSMRQ